MSLTDAQQQFLNDYIRTHRFSGRKKKQAEKYARRRDKVVEALDKLPETSSLYGELKKRLDGVDKVAQAGEFDQAYHDLKQIKADARDQAGGYDPTEALGKVGTAVDAFALKANDMLGKKIAVDNWHATQAPPRLAQIVVVPDAQIPQLADYESTEAWASARKQLIANTAGELKNRIGGMFDGYPENEASALDNFYHSADGEVAKIKQQLKDVARGCSERGHKQQLNDAARKLSQEVLLNPALGPLRVTPDAEAFGPTAAGDCATQKANLTQQMKTRVAAVKEQLQQLRVEITGEATRGQKGREAPAKTTAAPAAWAEGELEDAKSKDAETLAQKAEAPRHVRAKAPDPVKAFGALLKSPADPSQLPADETVISDPAAAKDFFKNHVAANNPGGDAVFELLLKTPEQLKTEMRAELLAARGWNAEKLTDQQRQWLAAMENGAVGAVDELAPARLDSAAGTLTVGTEAYGNPVHLGTGGMGTVSRYQSATDPTRFVAVKTFKSDGTHELTDLDKQVMMEDMIAELRAHRELMKGSADAKGRQNILEFKEVARGADGTLSIVMEAVDGGDLEENRLAGAIANETGALPEEARALLNQFQMKQALEGMVYMRDMNMAHFDLKPENIFMTSDGTLKIADFGASEISENPEGSIPMTSPRGVTAGYRAQKDVNRNLDAKNKEDKQLDHKFDVHSLGATAGVMHAKEGSPNIGKSQWNDELIGGNFTGALARLYEGMTAEKKEDRITLEAALESSYLKNLDAYSQEDLKKLGELSTRYGKLAKKQIAAIGAALKVLRPDLYKTFEEFEKDPNKWGFKDIMARLSKQMFEERRKAAELTTKLQAAETPESEKFDLQTKVRELQEGVAKIQEAMRSGESPEMKSLAGELKALSDKILRPTSEKGHEEALRQLESTLSDGPAFANLIALPSMSGLFESWGIKHADVKKLAAYLGEDMTATAGAAELIYVTAHRGVKTFLAGLANRTAAACLGKGFARMLETMAWTYSKEHGGEAPDLAQFGDEEGLDVEAYQPSQYLDDASLQLAVKELTAAAGNPGKFVAYVADPSRRGLFNHCQVKHEDVVAAVGRKDADMSATQGAAELIFVQTFKEFQTLLGGTKQPTVVKPLRQGFQGVLDEMSKRYAAERNDEKPDLKKFDLPEVL